MEKLKPHQKKLWRRIYLGAFESGSTTDEAADMAHHAVQQWEDVGAFDDPDDDGPTASTSTPWAIVAKLLHDHHPAAFEAVEQLLRAKERRVLHPA